jgi:hypothetical protein
MEKFGDVFMHIDRYTAWVTHPEKKDDKVYFRTFQIKYYVTTTCSVLNAGKCHHSPFIPVYMYTISKLACQTTFE